MANCNEFTELKRSKSQVSADM